MAGTGTERRRYPRQKPAPGTLVLVTPEGGGANLVQRLIDVSAVGVCMVCTAPLAEGGRVRVEVTIPGVKDKSVVRGWVRWTKFLESRGREAHVAGIEFETVVESLSSRAAESSVLDIFVTLRVAVAQLRLYPKDSPQVLKVATDTYHSIHSFLETANTLTLSRTPKGLLVNGRPLPDRGTVSDSLESSMLQVMGDSQIKSITFRKGITLDELITFLHALTKKFWDVKDGREINRRLREQRVNQVSVDEVQYVALGEGDIVIEDAARKLAGGATELSKLLTNVDQILDSAVQEGMGGEARLHLMKRLLDQDPSLLKSAQEGAAVSTSAASPAPPREQGRLAFEAAKEALTDLARLLAESPVERHAAIRRVGKTIVDAFSHDPRLSAVMGAILSEEAVKALPSASPAEAPAKAAEAGAVGRVKEILGLPEEDRLQALHQEGNPLMDELSALGRSDLVPVLMSSLTKSLGERAPKKRLSAARAMNNLRRGMERSGGEEVVEAVVTALRSSLDAERDGSVYSVLADLLGFLADYRIRKGKADLARELLDLLHRHYAIKDSSFPQRAELAYGALERVAAGVGFSGLSERIRKGDAEALQVVESLGAAATRFLIREIRNADSAPKRMELAAMIARAGAGAATVLMDELQKTVSPTDIVQLIDVLPHAMPPEMAEMTLGGLLRHSAAAVRRKAASLLADGLTGRAGALVLDALGTEAEPATRLAFVESLGKNRHRAALEVLSRILDDRAQPDDLRSAAAIALGKIGDVRAVPVLTKLYAKGEKGLTKIFRSVPAAVRAAAARALASFPAHKEAREALRSAREDADPAVRAVAQQALYAPLQEVFGERALAVQVAATPKEIVAGLKVGGVFGEVPMEVLLERLGDLEAKGMLHVSFGGPSGRLAFDSGIIVAAEFEGRRDADAVQALGGRREGYWLLQPEEPIVSRRILMPVERALEELKRARPGSSASYPPTS